MRLRIVLSAFVALLILASSCARPEGPPLPTAPPRGVLIRFGKATLAAGVVAGPKGRARGLMNRRKIPSDGGLLFLFPGKVRGGFWMKNTLIPLAIAYMDWGGGETVLVKRLMKMEPCRSDPCRVYNPGIPYDAALEVNQGWFGRHGVERGAVGEIIGNLPKPS
jgi:hypothetical protein